MASKTTNADDCIDSITEERYEKLVKSLTSLFQSRSKEEALDLTIKEIQNFINAEGTSVWLTDRKDESKLILAKTYTTDGRLEVGASYYKAGKMHSGKLKGKYEGLTGYIFSTGSALKIDNITNKNEIQSISESLMWSDKYKGWAGEKEKRRPFLGVPIISVENNNRTIGVLRIATTKDRKPFTDLDLKLAKVFSRCLSFILGAFDRKDLELDLFTSLYAPIEKESLPTIEDLIHRAIQKFTSLFPGSHGSILLEGDKGKFYFKVSSRLSLMQRITSGELNEEYYTSGQGKTGKIIEAKAALLFTGNKKNPLESEKPKNSCEIDEPATSFIGAPIFDVSQNRVVGVIRSAKHSQNPENDFQNVDKALLESFSRQISFLYTFCNNLKKKDILGIMHGFIDPQDIDSVVEKFSVPKTPSYELTIMFVDIIGFTDFCNNTLDSDPRRIIAFLNTFFETMGDLVKMNNGIINAIKGDEFLALFNAFKPCYDHRLKAVESAFIIVEEFFHSFQKKLIKKMDGQFGILYPETIFNKIGLKVGLHTTQNVVMGAMGPKDSQTITITGQDVNLASRLITEIADLYPEDDKLILSFSSTYNNSSVASRFKATHSYHNIRGTDPSIMHKIFKITDRI